MCGNMNFILLIKKNGFHLSCLVMDFTTDVQDGEAIQ